MQRSYFLYFPFFLSSLSLSSFASFHSFFPSLSLFHIFNFISAAVLSLIDVTAIEFSFFSANFQSSCFFTSVFVSPSTHLFSFSFMQQMCWFLVKERAEEGADWIAGCLIIALHWLQFYIQFSGTIRLESSSVCVCGGVDSAYVGRKLQQPTHLCYRCKRIVPLLTLHK